MITRLAIVDRTDVQKKKIPFRTSFFPLDGLNRQEMKQLKEGTKFIERFNEKIAQAKLNSTKH